MYDLTSCLCVWEFRHACSDLKKRLWEDDKSAEHQKRHNNQCGSQPLYPSLCPDKDTRLSRKAWSHYNHQDKFPVKLFPINVIGIYLKRLVKPWNAWKCRLWVGTWKSSLEQSRKTSLPIGSHTQREWSHDPCGIVGPEWQCWDVIQHREWIHMDGFLVLGFSENCLPILILDNTGTSQHHRSQTQGLSEYPGKMVELLALPWFHFFQILYKHIWYWKKILNSIQNPSCKGI